jgi:ferredoxin
MVKVDQDKCIGCGLCAGLCPDSFRLNADGKSEVIKEEATDCAKEAAAQCPVNCIEVK